MADEFEQYRVGATPDSSSGGDEFEQYRQTPQPVSGVIPKLKNAASVAGSDLSGLPAHVIGAIFNAINAAPREISGAGSQIFSDPARAGKNIVTGVGEARNAAVNIPSDILGYFAHLGLIDPKYSEAIRAKENLTNMFAPDEEKQPGDTLLQMVPGLAPMVPSGLNLLKEGAKAVVSPLTGGEKMKRLKQSAEQAGNQFKLAEQAEQEAKDQATLAGHPSDVTAVQKKSLDTQGKLQNLYADLQNKPQKLPANINESSANLEKSQQMHQQANDAYKDIQDSLAKHLNQGKEFDVHAARAIKKIQEAKTSEIGQGYKDLEKDFDQRNVQVNNADAIKQKNDELISLIQNNAERNGRTKEVSNVIDQLEKLRNADTSVNAKDYLHALQSTKQYAREARTKAYQPGMNREERTEWQNRFNELDDKVSEMEQTLEDGVGAENVSKLKELNSRWRNEVVPLYSNRTYQNIKKNTQMPDDIIKTLRGDQPGNVLIKNIIKNDPETLRNVIGQRYAIKPNELHSPNERMQEYIQNDPQLKELLRQHQDAKNAIDLSKQNLQEAENHHAAMIKNQELNQKNAGDYQKKVQDIHDTQTDLANLDRTISDLRQKSSRKNISLEEKLKTEKELDRAIKKRHGIRLISGAAGAYTFNSILKGLGNISESNNKGTP